MFIVAGCSFSHDACVDPPMFHSISCPQSFVTVFTSKHTSGPGAAVGPAVVGESVSSAYHQKLKQDNFTRAQLVILNIMLTERCLTHLSITWNIIKTCCAPILWGVVLLPIRSGTSWPLIVIVGSVTHDALPVTRSIMTSMTFVKIMRHSKVMAKLMS